MLSRRYQLILSAATHTGQVRANNEDTFLLYNLERDEKLRPGGCEATTAGKGVVVIVSDGMGGANAGEIASAMAVETIVSHLVGHAPDDPCRSSKKTCALFEEAIQLAHDTILKSSLEDETRQGMGATLTALWLAENKAWLAQVGDSRLYRLNDEEIIQVSDDQTPVGHLLRAGKISAQEARHHPQKNLLDQALGAGMSSVHPFCAEIDFQETDCFLLCTDGITDALEDHQMREIVAHDARWSLPTACKYLINGANEAYGQDNLTVALCRITRRV